MKETYIHTHKLFIFTVTATDDSDSSGKILRSTRVLTCSNLYYFKDTTTYCTCMAWLQKQNLISCENRLSLEGVREALEIIKVGKAHKLGVGGQVRHHAVEPAAVMELHPGPAVSSQA